MSEKLKPIDAFADQFFEWDGDKKTPYVTLTSAKMFAEEWVKRAQPEAIHTFCHNDACAKRDSYPVGPCHECGYEQTEAVTNAGDVYERSLIMANGVINDYERSQRMKREVKDYFPRREPTPDTLQYARQFVELHDRAATAEADLAKARSVIADLAGAINYAQCSDDDVKSLMQGAKLTETALTTTRNYLEGK